MPDQQAYFFIGGSSTVFNIKIGLNGHELSYTVNNKNNNEKRMKRYKH